MAGFRVDASGLEKVAKALQEVAEATRAKIISRALNRTGDQAATQMKRVLSKETGLRIGRVASVMKKIRAGGSRTRYEIIVRDKWTTITAGNFGAREVKMGVRHRAWGRSQTAKGAFIVGGVAYHRQGPERMPIKALYGPNIAKEMLRGESFKVAEAKVNEVFIPRVLHEIDRELQRVKGKYGL